MDWLPISELDPILKNEALTRGLQDPEAQLLVKWLVWQCEHRAHADGAEPNHEAVSALCHKAKAIKRFVLLYCYHCNSGAAYQLAASMRFAWPLPKSLRDPYDLMEEILDWETESLFAT